MVDRPGNDFLDQTLPFRVHTQGNENQLPRFVIVRCRCSELDECRHDILVRLPALEKQSISFFDILGIRLVLDLHRAGRPSGQNLVHRSCKSSRPSYNVVLTGFRRPSVPHGVGGGQKIGGDSRPTPRLDELVRGRSIHNHLGTAVGITRSSEFLLEEDFRSQIVSIRADFLNRKYL